MATTVIATTIVMIILRRRKMKLPKLEVTRTAIKAGYGYPGTASKNISLA